MQAEIDIKPYLGIFKGCYEKALDKFNAVTGSYGGSLFTRTKAVIFHNIVVNEIKSTFFGMDGVQIIEKYESLSLIINQYISARFKKFNKHGLPQNARSKRNNLRIAQQLEFGYSNYPPIAFIDVGYKMDITGTKYEQLKVICRKHNDILWDLYFDIDDNKQGTKEADVRPDKPQTGETRFKVNKENKKDKKTGNS
jgi:hypothetical protein